ncbi:MAG: nucleotide sugar dehydrogenase [Candidatus Syntrophonatronum acetioxidans]|uniref:Nucleotide sugar dehydrogenase n=1 Tax=Candidatus Syntrophonatronum acetioxidans TaxID=1795816 RepID=A0A424YG72_9FIRM|nr:MAG: nucleotide sugar dehydrogenase [Candidatus Syntrophonatronum acetioxidans]
MDKKICIMGLGYIGLPTAAFFASAGYQVVGVDVSSRVVKGINGHRIHVEEPGLAQVVKKGVKEEKLWAKESPEEADVFILAVPTPLKEDCKGDMGRVEEAARAILPYLRPGNLVILESTVGPGTTRDLLCPLLARSGLRIGEELMVAFCPERVLPGKIMEEMVYNNRIVGGINEESSRRARDLYRSFVQGEIYLTDATTAEMVKLMENTFRDVNIALANEMALISSRLGIDVGEAIELANKHPRVNLHQPGPGVGGHCLAVDPWFIVEKAPAQARLIAQSRRINDGMPSHVASLILEALKGLSQPKVALLGMAYKGNVNDLRESPALKVAEILQENGLSLGIHDPHVEKEDLAAQGLIWNSLPEAVEGAELLVVLTDHREYKLLDPEEIAPLVKNRVVLDTRRVLDKTLWQDSSFKVVRIGEGGVNLNPQPSSL